MTLVEIRKCALLSFLAIDQSVFYSFGDNHYGLNRSIPTLTKHAEANAIDHLKIKQGKRIKCDMFVFRVNSKGELGMSKPCKKCIEYIKMNGAKKGYAIRRIYYNDRTGILQKMNA